MTHEADELQVVELQSESSSPHIGQVQYRELTAVWIRALEAEDREFDLVLGHRDEALRVPTRPLVR